MENGLRRLNLGPRTSDGCLAQCAFAGYVGPCFSDDCGSGGGRRDRSLWVWSAETTVMLLVKDTKTRFGVVSVLLHWYIAATILFLLLTGETMRYLGAHGPLRPFRESLAQLHMSFAITAVPFILYRIYSRLRSGKPN